MTEVFMEPRDGHLFVRLAGKLEDSVMDLIPSAEEACRQSNLSRVLVDFTAVNITLDGLGRFMFGINLAEKWPRDLEVGVLLSETQTVQGRPVELVLSNRGVKIHLFTNPEKAIAWATRKNP